MVGVDTDTTMPFQIPHHHHTTSDPQFNHDNYYGVVNSLFSAGQRLSSIGAPNPYYLDNSQNTPNTASDSRSSYLPQPQPNTNGNGTVIPYRPGPAPSAYSGSQEAQPGQYQPGLRRSLTVGRYQPDELHMNQQGSAMSDVHHYGAPPAYSGEGLSIKIEPSTPQHPGSVSSQPVPGTLQPGGLASRSVPLGASNNTTLPQLPAQIQQPPLSARPMTMNHSHSYSLSSPGAMDQPKYKPFSNTPEQSKYPTGSNAYMPQTPLGPSSYSPLGLADIRQRTEHNYSDMSFSPGLAQETESAPCPQNSNYTAPWPIYAVDWCKWSPRQGTVSSGKVAIGSYMEDNHNYVSAG